MFILHNYMSPLRLSVALNLKNISENGIETGTNIIGKHRHKQVGTRTYLLCDRLLLGSCHVYHVEEGSFSFKLSLPKLLVQICKKESR